MPAYLPNHQPFRQAGGQHPSGAHLSYSLTTQPSGKVRLNGYNNGVMVICAYNLSPVDADTYALDFMRDGDQLNPVIRRHK